MGDFDSEMLVATFLDATFSFLKFWAIIGVLFPLWELFYIVLIMFPLWTISDFFNIQGVGTRNNDFFIANIFGYALIAFLNWLLFFILKSIKKLFINNKK